MLKLRADSAALYLLCFQARAECSISLRNMTVISPTCSQVSLQVGRKVCVCVCWICMSHMCVVKKEGDGREQRKKEKRDERKKRDAVKVAAEM